MRNFTENVLHTLAPYLEDGARLMLRMFLVLAVLVFVIHGIIAVTYRYPLDYGEAPLVDQALRLGQGENIYRRDLSTPPYTISNYPPLYVLTLTPFVQLFGPTFLPGRFLSLLATIATAVFLAQIIHAHTQDRNAALITGALFLAIRYVVGWSSLARVDMLALAFSTAALALISRSPDRWVGAGLLLLAAIYTRQSYGLAAPLAVCIRLWRAQGWRAAFRVAGLIGGGGLLLLLILNLVTGGGFIFNTITANVNPFEIETVERYWRELSHMAPILLVGAGAYLFLDRRASSLRPLLLPYLGGSLLSAAMIGKLGSNVNYLLELSAALSLVTGALLTWKGYFRAVNDAPAAHWWPPYLRAAVRIILAIQVGLLLRETLQNPVRSLSARIQAKKSLEKDLTWFIQEADGPILADEYMGMLTLQQRPLTLQPFEMTQLANAGLWDQTPLLEEIEAQRFPLIFIHHFLGEPVYLTRWTPEMLDAILANYAPTHFKADSLIYRPRNTQAPEDLPPTDNHCPDAPWPLPTSADMGIWWFSKMLAFMGRGEAGTVPVYAVAEGLLTRRADWADAVAIQHEDPLHPGEQVWTFYGGMQENWEGASLVAPAFPPGSEGLPVRAGELLGYQGQWWEGPLWVHAHFAVVPARADGSFPAAMVGRETESDAPLPYELDKEGLRDPSLYLGTIRSVVMNQPVWLPLRCQNTQ